MYRGEPPAWYWSDRARAAAPPPAVSAMAPQNMLVFAAFEVTGCAFGTVDRAGVSAAVPNMRWSKTVVSSKTVTTCLRQ